MEKICENLQNFGKKNEKFVKKKLYGDNTPRNAVGYGAPLVHRRGRGFCAGLEEDERERSA